MRNICKWRPAHCRLFKPSLSPTTCCRFPRTTSVTAASGCVPRSVQQALAAAAAVLEACVGGVRAPLEDPLASSFYFNLLRTLRALVPEVQPPPPATACRASR